MKKLLLVALLLITGLGQCPDDSKADSICVDCDASAITTTLVDAGDFPGADIGEKINNAIDSFASGKEGTVYVPPSAWCGASYSTMISLDKPVTVIFPGSTCQATYTGTTAALKQTGAGSKGKTVGFGVTESGNANSNVDGILIDATDAMLSDCGHSWFRITATVRHGVNLEAKNNGIFQCNFSNGRITSPGGDNLIIDTTGSAKANSNAFNKLTLSSTPASHNSIRSADGLANVFRDVYIQAGNATAQAIYDSADYSLYENVTIDADMTLGVKTDAGNHIFLGLQNNATGTKESITSTGKLFKVNLDGTLMALDGAVGTPSITFTSDPDTGLYWTTSGTMFFAGNGTAGFQFASDGANIGTGQIKWAASVGGTKDVVLTRDAAGSLHLTNNTDAQDTVFGIWADRGDDAADKFSFTSSAANTLVIKNNTTTLWTMTSAGELNIVTISGDGSGKVVCIKSDGNLGTCTSAVGAGGTCTCS